MVANRHRILTPQIGDPRETLFIDNIKRVAPLRSTADINRVRRAAPTKRASTLNALRNHIHLVLLGEPSATGILPAATLRAHRMQTPCVPGNPRKIEKPSPSDRFQP